MIHTLNKQNTILNKFLSEIRDENTQKDSMRFRRNLERVGEIMAYEISKTFKFSEENITTPLGIAKENVPEMDNVVVATILRAGLPLHQGFLNYFDTAENAFVSAYRKYQSKEDFDIHIEYLSSPLIDGKTVIITDPMLASGKSMHLAYEALLTKGKPAFVHFASVISSTDGIDYLQKAMKTDDYAIWTAAVDEELTVKSYIVPGLGDAGDLAYGEKDG